MIEGAIELEALGEQPVQLGHRLVDAQGTPRRHLLQQFAAAFRCERESCEIALAALEGREASR